MSLLLSVDDLTVAFVVDGEWVPMVRGVDLTVAASEIVGLVGESGSGKTLTALSIACLLPPEARILRGRVDLAGEDLLQATGARLRQVRGSKVAMVFQEPITALNPVLTVGFQVREAIQVAAMNRQDKEKEASRLLDLVGIPGAARRLGNYPHQLSGGQRQRVMIAMALAAEPELLIADEPTSALDVTVQAEILALLEDLRSRLGLAILLITHDLSVVARTCDRVMVMYAGQIVEKAATHRLFDSPAHPYTQGLVASIPKIGARRPAGGVPTLPGQVPDSRSLPRGCSFHPRCSEERAQCSEREPVLLPVVTDQEARCILHETAGVLEEGS